MTNSVQEKKDVVIESSAKHETFTINSRDKLVAPQGSYLTMIADGKECDMLPGDYNNVEFVVTPNLGMMGSYIWENGDSKTPPYRTAAFVEGDKVVKEKSATGAITGGELTDTKLSGAAITSETGDFSGVLVDNATYTISNVTMDFGSPAVDGKTTQDFAGVGNAMMVTGDKGKLVIEDSTITTTGVAKCAVMVDDGASLIVKNTTMHANGGTVYDGYVSCAEQSIMVCVPWVLGLDGAVGNARTTNLMGDYTTAAYVDSTITARGWAALSTDGLLSGELGWGHLVAVNCDVKVEKSGYGAYAFLDCTEDFYGVKMDVESICVILCGGIVNLSSYEIGAPIDVYKLNGTKLTDRDKADRNKVFGVNGDLVDTVKGTKGSGLVNTEFKSQHFGFECHSNFPQDWNVVNLNAGTKVETGDALMLVKKTNAELNVDNAEISSGTGVLMQVMDNDDDYIGLNFEVQWGEDNPRMGRTVGNHIPTFNSAMHQAPGFSDEFAVEGATFDSTWVSNATFTNGTYEGDLWNSTGYVGQNGATTMNVAIGKDASLKGLISAGAFSHLKKDIVVQDGDWSEAIHLGHVKNKVNWNGFNNVNVTIENGGTWTVTKECVVSSVDVKDGGTLVGEVSENGDGTLTVKPK